MAASRSLGVLTLDLIAKIGGFEQGMDRAARTADRKGREISAAARKRAKETEEAWSKVGTVIGAVFSSIAVGAVFQKFIAETKQAEQEQAQLAAVLKSTGNAAGYSQERLNQMADAMQQSLGVAAGDVNSAQTVLLAFTNIVGDKLPAALQAAADHAARTGSTIQASAEIMGRALDVPSVGMASLQKQGFKFSESQIEVARELERTGQIAAAQQMVLDSLNESYGGAAAAARDTFGGALGALQNTINDLLTGDSGSMAQMKKSVEGLNATLSSEETRAAFQTLISFMAGLATQAARTAAVLNSGGIWGWLSVSNKEADDIKGTVDTVTGQIDRLKKQRDELDPAKSVTNKLNDFFFGDVGDLDRQISVLEGKLKGAKARLALDQTTTPDLAPILAPDLAPRAPGVVNLKDGDKKGGRASGKSQAEKDADAAEKYLKNLRDQANQIKEMTAYERLLYDIREGAVQFGMQAQFQEAERLAIMADFGKDGAKLLEEQNKLKEDGKRLTEQTLTPMEQLRKEQERINNLLAGGHISPDVAQRAMGQAKASAFGIEGDVSKWISGEVKPLAGGQFDEQQARYQAEAEAEIQRYEEQYTRLQEALGAQQIAREEAYLLQEQMAQTHASRMDQINTAQFSVMLGSAEQGFASLAETMKSAQGESSGVYKAMFAVSKAFAIAQATLGMTNAISSAMALPFPANLAAAGAAAGYMATILSSVQSVAMAGFAEGGYTGAGGKFDVAGMVHKGEGVLSQRDIGAMGGPSAFEAFRASLHTGYADGGYVSAAQPGYADGPAQAAPAIVNIIEDSSKAGQVEEKRDDMDRHIINVFVRNIRGGGEAAEAIQGTWGLDRKGR